MTVQLRRCEITVRVWNVLSVLLFYSWHKYFWNPSVTFYVFSQLDQREPFLSYDASFCLVCESAAAWNNYKHLICNMVGQHVIWTVSFPVQRVAVPSMCKITHTAFLWSDCKYYFSSCCCKMVVDIFISWRKCTHIQKEDVENSHKTNVGNSISPNHGFPEYAVMGLVTGSCNSQAALALPKYDCKIFFPPYLFSKEMKIVQAWGKLLQSRYSVRKKPSVSSSS